MLKNRKLLEQLAVEFFEFSKCLGFHSGGHLSSLEENYVNRRRERYGVTPHQVYRYGTNAYGFLCHLEVTARHVADWVTMFVDEIHDAGADARAILAGTKRHLPALQAIGRSVFTHWAEVVSKAH